MAKINRDIIQQSGYLDFIARQVVEGFITGLHKSPFHGFSVEFAEHRLYNKGESVKHIDWKLYARTDKLFVKRFEEETNLRCRIILDNSSSMYFPITNKAFDIDNLNKISFSVFCAASIMTLLQKQRDAVGLSIFSDNLDFHSQTASKNVHHQLILSELENLLDKKTGQERKNTNVAKNLHLIAESIHKRSLVILFSDMFNSEEDPNEIFSALQHLKHNKHEVILFHVVDKEKELDFEYSNRPYRFIDLESGQELKIKPQEVKKHYLEQMQKYKNELELKCAAYNIDFVEADINKGFNAVLLPYLLKRQRML